MVHHTTAHPFLASGLETPVRWVIIIEIWYSLSNRARGNKQIGRTLPVICAKAPRAAILRSNLHDRGITATRAE